MNQQEIIENLPPLPLHKGDGSTVNCVTGMHVLDCYSKDYSNDVDEVMQHAITHAINNTYGNGINPESVPDMFNVLHILGYYLHEIEEFEMATKVKDILNKATLLKTFKNK